MTTKVVRGQVITVEAHPHDHAGNPVAPAAMLLYLNYKHANGTVSTDPAIDMEMQPDGLTWLGSFDSAFAQPGAVFGSIRAELPGLATDFKLQIVSNEANPDLPFS
jgi:hypothetical protein